MKSLSIRLAFLLITFFAAITIDLTAQGVEREAKTTANASQIYLEVGGSAFIYSVNYDGRFGPIENGLGMRIGIGGASADGSGYVAVPAQINYLMGSRGQYFEIGGGITYISIDDFFDDNVSNIFGSFTLGFRKQPFGKKGLTWRIAFTPFIGGGGFIPWGGASVGFRF